MRFRPSGLRFLFFLAGFAATAAFLLFVADFFGAAIVAFCAAQRFLTASAIRFLPSGERFLFFFFAGLAAGVTAASIFLGLPTFLFATGAALPLSNARACCNWAIS